MAPGVYDVRVGSSNGIVSIQNSRDAVMPTSFAITAKTAADTGKLVFKRYGHTYFLSSVTGLEYGLGRQLRAPKANQEWALTNSPDTIVEIALATR